MPSLAAAADPQLRNAAVALSRRVGAEDGVAAAVRLLEAAISARLAPFAAAFDFGFFGAFGGSVRT